MKIAKELKEKFEIALESNDPSESLWKLAHDLRNQGMKQIELYFLYEHYHQLVDADDPKYDAIVDSLDIIWGGAWAIANALYEHELTSEEVQKFRTDISK